MRLIVEALVFGDEISTQAALMYGNTALGERHGTENKGYEEHEHAHAPGHRRLKYAQNKDNTYGDDELHRLWISVPLP